MVPSIDGPSIDGPSIGVPSIDMPSIDMPSIDVPSGAKVIATPTTRVSGPSSLHQNGGLLRLAFLMASYIAKHL
jgi:hypothetical protein